VVLVAVLVSVVVLPDVGLVDGVAVLVCCNTAIILVGDLLLLINVKNTMVNELV